MMRIVVCLLLALSAAASCRASSFPYEPRDELVAGVSSQVKAGRFAALLQDADTYQKSEARLPDGRWKLALFYRGLHESLAANANDDSDWLREEAALVALTKRHPRSSNAWLLLAALHISHAWKVRGPNFADKVSDADFRKFQSLLKKAAAILDAHQAEIAANPESYALRIEVAAPAGASAGALDAILAEGSRKSPGYQQTWSNRLNFLEPEWGGSVDEMAALINRSATQGSPSEGTGMMARLLGAASRTGYPDLVLHKGIDWSAVKKSYDDVLDRFPDDFNARVFFYDSCVKSDKVESAHLLSRMKSLPTPDQVGDNAVIFNACVKWARGELKAFFMQDERTGETTLIQ